MKKKYILALITSFVFIYLFILLGKSFSPGSYPFAEKYELDYPYDVVKKTIVEFKQKNRNYSVPKVTINNSGSWDLIDEPKGSTKIWYGFYFYNGKENKIYFTLIQSIDKNKTEFSFVAINNGLNIGNWKDINNDLNYFENKKEKENFESSILQHLKQELSTKNKTNTN
jgi:hypothetical protein